MSTYQTEPRRLSIVEGRAVPDPGTVLDTDAERAAGYRPLGVTPRRAKKHPALDLLIAVGLVVSLAFGIGYFGFAVAIGLWVCVAFIPLLTYLINRDEFGESDTAHLEQKRWGDPR